MSVAEYASQTRSAILETPHIVSHSLGYEDRPPVAGILKGSATFADGTVLHFKEYLQLYPTSIRLKYAYHYVTASGSLIFPIRQRARPCCARPAHLSTPQARSHGPRSVRGSLALGSIARSRRSCKTTAAINQAVNALTAAHLFFRDVEHKFQMVHDLQTHSLPAETTELERCAFRMGYGAEDRKKAIECFQADHQRHTERVYCTFLSFFVETTTSPVFQATRKLIALNR